MVPDNINLKRLDMGPSKNLNVADLILPLSHFHLKS